jgi:tRNA C32,U32 (ribose-2'-O)-methylase TrmJ
MWEPKLDPPALLEAISIILVSPRRPISVGNVARAAACFECEDMRIVQPRCGHLTRHAKSASKGAQYILHRSQT